MHGHEIASQQIATLVEAIDSQKEELGSANFEIEPELMTPGNYNK